MSADVFCRLSLCSWRESTAQLHSLHVIRSLIPTHYCSCTVFIIAYYFGYEQCLFLCLPWVRSGFYAPQLVPAGTAEARISYGNSV